MAAWRTQHEILECLWLLFNRFEEFSWWLLSLDETKIVLVGLERVGSQPSCSFDQIQTEFTFVGVRFRDVHWTRVRVKGDSPPANFTLLQNTFDGIVRVDHYFSELLVHIFMETRDTLVLVEQLTLFLFRSLRLRVWGVFVLGVLGVLVFSIGITVDVLHWV